MYVHKSLSYLTPVTISCETLGSFPIYWTQPYQLNRNHLCKAIELGIIHQQRMEIFPASGKVFLVGYLPA